MDLTPDWEENKENIYPEDNKENNYPNIFDYAVTFDIPNHAVDVVALLDNSCYVNAVENIIADVNLAPNPQDRAGAGENGGEIDLIILIF